MLKIKNWLKLDFEEGFSFRKIKDQATLGAP